MMAGRIERIETMKVGMIGKTGVNGYGPARYAIVNDDGSFITHEDAYGHEQITIWRSIKSAQAFINKP